MQFSRHAVRFGAVLILTLLTPLMAVNHSTAQSGTMVVATWGGAYSDALREAFTNPFSEESGVEVAEGREHEGAQDFGVYFAGAGAEKEPLGDSEGLGHWGASGWDLLLTAYFWFKVQSSKFKVVSGF